MLVAGTIGIGFLILLIVWVLAIVACAFSKRTDSSLGGIAVGLAVIITVTLASIPLEKQLDSVDLSESTLDDHNYVYRQVYFIYILLVFVFSALACFVDHCLDRMTPKPVQLTSN